MRRPPRDPGEAILSRAFLSEITLFALLITAVVLMAFTLSLRGDGSEARAITVAFMTLALAQTFHLGNARGSGPMLGWRRAIGNRWALTAVALTVALQLIAVYAAPLARVLHVVPLAARDWLVLVPLALAPAVAGQAAAWLGLRRGAAA
jgi:Ca2+-transporting ATPase